MVAAAPAPAKPPPVKIDEPEELKGTKWSGMELESGTSTKDVAADSAFERVFERLYGKMTFEEKLRLIWLAGTLFFIIGGYWLLRSLKDPVIATICGVEYIPKAKMLSVLVVLVLVFVYNKLIDMFPKHQLFYIVGGFYAGLFTLIACLLAAPATAQTSIYNTNASPYRLIGWISYCSIESFGSIGVSLFWAFTNSTYNLEGAKKAYGLMVACAQLGSIAGPTLVSVGTEAYGVPTIYFCGALCMVAMVLRRRPLSFLSRRVACPSTPSRRGRNYRHSTPSPRRARRWRHPTQVVSIYGYNLRFPQQPDSPRTSTKKKSSAGMTEGLVLFWKYHYVKGIFALSCLFMVEVTILDYSMKVLAKAKFDEEHPGDPHAATRAFASFMGVFGQAANGLSFCFSLLGTSMVIRRLGLNRTLLLFPTLCLGAICFVYTTPTLEAVFLAMLLLKGFSYCLNNPCKEILYQPVWKSNLRRVRPESPRRPPRHRRDTCSMACRCRFLTARRSQRGHVIAEK